MRAKRFTIFGLVFLAAVIFALTLLSPGTRAVELKPLKVAFGMSVPPYAIATERRGMSYDIVKEALATAGYRLDPEFLDFGKESAELTAGRVAAVMTMTKARLAPIKAHLSSVYIVYHNYAMTLASRHLKIGRAEDLAGKSVIAFERAREILGPSFAAATQAPGKYTEVAEQYHQNVALFSDKVDVVIADINIFRWYNHDPRVTAAVDVSQKVSYHKIFPPTPYRVAFKDADVRDAFDRALAKLKSSGHYQEIIDSYGGVIN